MKFKFFAKIVFFIGLIVFYFGPAGFSEDRSVSLNFENADLRLVIKFVSETTGENFIVDEGVKGNVTILGPTKIPINELRKVLESVLTVSGYSMVSSGQVTKIVPIENASQASPEMLSSGQSPAGGEHFITQIFSLKYGNVEKISGIINSFLSKGGHATSYPPTHTLIVSDRAENMKRIALILEDLDRKGSEVSSVIHVVLLKHANAEEVAQVLSQLFEKESKSLEREGIKLEEKESFVVADVSTNSLLIHVPKGRFSALRKTIQKLDLPQKQVLVEVLVAEVNLNKSEHLGIEWLAAEGVVYGSQEGFGQDRVNRAEDIAHHVLTGGKFPGTATAFIHDTIQVGTLEIPRLGILINAFRNHSDINILSTPQILTTDHKEAEILVGENRAFIKNAQVTPEGSTVRTFEFKDIGLSLRLKPHIADDGWVRMEVDQKVEDVIGQSFEGAVETSKREAHTMITVRDSRTAVIGGLIRERKDKTIQKVPILGDIPIIGIPFTRKGEQTVKTNLLIFICPHVLDTEEKMSEITEKKKQILNSNI
ncbi:MAG: hypothetical protein HYS07_00575 [Chlamydiae bacterium]|nr:hypothetical protein [Chlamydiota bacterium]MBI3278154.1 hypothetical protein [Chlamydiota bacterium]